MVCLVVRVGSFDGVKVMFGYTTIFDISIKELFRLLIIAYALPTAVQHLFEAHALGSRYLFEFVQRAHQRH
jgi:hypothetical protein